MAGPAVVHDQMRKLGGPVGRQFAGRVGLFLRVDDFPGTLTRLRAAGVEILGEPRQESYGQVVVFRDPFGNKWDLLSGG